MPTRSARRLALVLLALTLAAPPAAWPLSTQAPEPLDLAFDCAQPAPGSPEAVLCADEALLQLESRFNLEVKRLRRMGDPVPKLDLDARQWMAARTFCMKPGFPAPAPCLRRLYERRHADLLARSGQLPRLEERSLRCGSAATVSVRRFTTNDLVLATRGPQVVSLYREPFAAGYADESQFFGYRQVAGEDLLRWGRGAAEEKCVLVKANPATPGNAAAGTR